MISLDTTLISLQAVLAGAPATSQPECHVWYYDVPAQAKETNEEYKIFMYRSVANSGTDVVICPAPPTSGTTRHIVCFAYHNKDTASVVLVIKTDDGTTERVMLKKTLTTLQTLWYDNNSVPTLI